MVHMSPFAPMFCYSSQCECADPFDLGQEGVNPLENHTAIGVLSNRQSQKSEATIKCRAINYCICLQANDGEL